MRDNMTSGSQEGVTTQCVQLLASEGRTFINTSGTTSLASAGFKHSRAGLVVTDAQHRVLLTNPAFETITGYRCDQVLGSDIHSLLADQSHDYFRALDQLSHSGYWQGEVYCRRQDGEIHPELLSVNAIRDGDGQIRGYVRSFIEISDLKSNESQLQLMAHHDPLTGLANRSLFDDHLQRALNHAERTGTSFAILFIDLDRFKPVNDSLGHAAGDEMLKKIAIRLTQALRSEDVLARFGGDEFLVLLEYGSSRETAQAVALRIQEALEAPVKVAGKYIPMSASIGIALYPEDGQNASELLSSADSAMYAAKHAGGSSHSFVDPAISYLLQEQLTIEMALSEAVREPESAFRIVYQPQCNLATGRVVGLEALLRWNDGRYFNHQPRECIALARKLGLAIRLDRWVIGEVAKQRQAWQAAGSGLGNLPISVNIVDDHLHPGRSNRLPLDQYLRQIVDDASWLTLEIACDSLVSQPESTQHLFRRLQRLGVNLALDELGDGHINFAYLSRLPIRQAKVNGVLINSLANDPRSQKLLGGIHRLLETLDIQCIAVGVENQQSLDAMSLEGPYLAQGNHLAVPMFAEHLCDWYRSYHA